MSAGGWLIAVPVALILGWLISDLWDWLYERQAAAVTDAAHEMTAWRRYEASQPRSDVDEPRWTP